MGFLAGIGQWVLTFLIDYLWKKIVPAISRAVNDFFAKRKRDAEQSEAKKKLDEDVKEGAPRTDEMRKNEKDWLNS